MNYIQALVDVIASYFLIDICKFLKIKFLIIIL